MPVNREPIIQEASANVVATTTGVGESITTVNEVQKRPQTSEVNASQHAPTHSKTLNMTLIFSIHILMG